MYGRTRNRSCGRFPREPPVPRQWTPTGRSRPTSTDGSPALAVGEAAVAADGGGAASADGEAAIAAHGLGAASADGEAAVAADGGGVAGAINVQSVPVGGEQCLCPLEDAEDDDKQVSEPR